MKLDFVQNICGKIRPERPRKAHGVYLVSSVLVLLAVGESLNRLSALPGQQKVPPEVQKFCPVMTREEIDPETSPRVVYEGVSIYLCCDQCVNKFRRDPPAYLDPEIVPALRRKKLPPRGLEQIYCPVLRDRKVSSKDPFTIYKGVKIYFYNELARQRFEKDPERYADPKILPQLEKASKLPLE